MDNNDKKNQQLQRWDEFLIWPLNLLPRRWSRRQAMRWQAIHKWWDFSKILGRQLFARGANGPMSPVSSALRAMRGAPVIAAMRTFMKRVEAAGRSKAESSASINHDELWASLIDWQASSYFCFAFTFLDKLSAHARAHTTSFLKYDLFILLRFMVIWRFLVSSWLLKELIF